MNGVWFVKSVARLENVLSLIRKALTTTEGFGLMSEDSMEPEVLQAWKEFLAGELNEEDLESRMRIIQPVLRARRRRKRH